MIGKRLKKANLIAKRRFNRGIWGTCEEGSLRKNNTVCSCPWCCNPRNSILTKGKERLTIQERKAPTIKDFEQKEEV